MKKHSIKETTNSILILVGTILCFIALPLFLAGLLAFISPTMFYELMSNLPEDIQFIVASDTYLTYLPLSWSYMIGAAVLWFLGNYIRE